MGVWECHAGYDVRSIGRMDYPKAGLWLRCPCVWHGRQVARTHGTRQTRRRDDDLRKVATAQSVRIASYTSSATDAGNAARRRRPSGLPVGLRRSRLVWSTGERGDGNGRRESHVFEYRESVSAHGRCVKPVERSTALISGREVPRPSSAPVRLTVLRLFGASLPRPCRRPRSSRRTGSFTCRTALP